MTKRTITSHKGNRDKRFPETRCTQETLVQIATILDHRNRNSDKKFSLADWVAEKAAEEAETIKSASTLCEIFKDEPWSILDCDMTV